MSVLNKPITVRMLVLAALAILTVSFVTKKTQAVTPGIINYQGRVQVAGSDYTGSGLFKFALVNPGGTMTYWSNDGSSTTGNEPTAAVTLSVIKGLYAVILGDASLANMTVLPPSVFSNSDVRLRIWFNDGTNGSLLLTPDQRVTAVGYAMVAAAVDDMPKARVFSSLPISIPSGGSGATASFDSVRYDSSSAKLFNATNPTRLTAPVSGVYQIGAAVDIAGGPSSLRIISIRLNGSTIIGSDSRDYTSDPAEMTTSIQYLLNAGDFVELLFYQNSGTTLQTIPASAPFRSCEFMMNKLP